MINVKKKIQETWKGCRWPPIESAEIDDILRTARLEFRQIRVNIEHSLFRSSCKKLNTSCFFLRWHMFHPPRQPKLETKERDGTANAIDRTHLDLSLNVPNIALSCRKRSSTLLWQGCGWPPIEFAEIDDMQRTAGLKWRQILVSCN